MRRIDADKFILALMDASLSSVDEDTILDLVDSIPAVDAAPVVRCKDCRKFKTYACRMVASGYDDFCSYGERKDGGDAEG